MRRVSVQKTRGFERLLCDVDKRHIEIPEIINRATRRAAASMKRKQKEKN